jgi:hypothetical protein
MVTNLYTYGQAGSLACLLVLSVSSQDVRGEAFYQYKDTDGVVHFSNVPNDPRYRTVHADTRAQSSGSSAVPGQPVTALSAPLRETGGPRAGDAIYQYVDKDGGLHFTNVPTSPRYTQIRGPRTFSRAASTRITPALRRTITQASLEHRLHPALVRAVIWTESAYDPYAISPKGAMGLMQLMPETASSLNVANPYDPEQNIAGGARHLRYLLDRFGGNLELALAAYHAGETRVSRESRIPRTSETQEYVRRVLHFYEGFTRDGGQSVTRRFINYLSPN